MQELLKDASQLTDADKAVIAARKTRAPLAVTPSGAYVVPEGMDSATFVKISQAKHRVMHLNRTLRFVQSHKVSALAELNKFDPETVASVTIPGYDPEL